MPITDQLTAYDHIVPLIVPVDVVCLIVACNVSCFSLHITIACCLL